MTNFTPARPLQNLGAGDPRALGLTVLGAEAMTEFERGLAFGLHQMRKAFSGARDAQFPVLGRNSIAYHVPGQEIDGNIIQSAERKIALEDVRISPVFIAGIDEVLRHFDTRQPYAYSIGQALSRGYDTDVARTAILAARANSTIPGAQGHGDGTRLTNAAYATDGSVLFDGIFNAGVELATKDVPLEGLKAFIRPVQYALIVQSGRPIDRDLSPDNGSLAEGLVYRAGGIPIMRTNNVPNANDTANTAINVARRANYATTIGVVYHPSAIGTLDGVPIVIEDETSVRHQGTLLVGKYLAGHGILRPEAAAELRTAAP